MKKGYWRDSRQQGVYEEFIFNTDVVIVGNHQWKQRDYPLDAPGRPVVLGVHMESSFKIVARHGKWCNGSCTGSYHTDGCGLFLIPGYEQPQTAEYFAILHRDVYRTLDKRKGAVQTFLEEGWTFEKR